MGFQGTHLQLPDGGISGSLHQLISVGLQLPSRVVSHCKNDFLQLKGAKVCLRGRVTKPSIVGRKRKKVNFWGFVPNIANVFSGREGGESGSLAILGLILEPGQGRNVSGGRVAVLPHQWDKGGGMAGLT